MSLRASFTVVVERRLGRRFVPAAAATGGVVAARCASPAGNALARSATVGYLYSAPWGPAA